jgi:hypothetical protein
MTRVWELDLYFDSETKLALLTANVGTEKDSLTP